MKKFDYNSKEFNKLLDEYFQTNEFKEWADAWFPDVKEDVSIDNIIYSSNLQENKRKNYDFNLKEVSLNNFFENLKQSA